MTEEMATPLAGLSDTIDFDLLDVPMAQDIKASLGAAIESGARFDAPPDPLAIFRRALWHSIRRIEQDRQRFDLLVRFLRDGPYEELGPIPSELVHSRLTDFETEKAIRFIYHSVISSFQGALAELLAVGPCVRFFEREGRLEANAQIHIGDAIRLKTRNSERPAKGADVLLLEASGNHLRVTGVAEVKSYAFSSSRLEIQINRQLHRARRGFLVRDNAGGYQEVAAEPSKPVRIGVVPASWRLPRGFCLEGPDGSPGLFVDEPTLPTEGNRIVEVGRSFWRMTLRWSHEALASAAFDMAFWLMGEIGRIVYADKRPLEWAEMTPAAAGRNAAKLMLYYAVRRIRYSVGKDEHRKAGAAIALYNAYCFGYALGTAFRDSQGRREMLSFEDLDDIVANDVTRYGCRIQT